MSTNTKESFFKAIIKIQTRRAEIYTYLLNETAYINDYGIDQLNAYCQQAIPEFQGLSKEIRQLERQFNEEPINLNCPDQFVNRIQSVEQKKLTLVVQHIKTQVGLFGQSCPHNHMTPHDPKQSIDWKKDIFQQYRDQSIDQVLSEAAAAHKNAKNTEVIDGDKKCDDKACEHDHKHDTEEKVLTTETTATAPTEEPQAPCLTKHGDNDHDEHQRALQEAKRVSKMTFLSTLSELDDELNEVMDDIRAELFDLVDAD